MNRGKKKIQIHLNQENNTKSSKLIQYQKTFIFYRNFKSTTQSISFKRILITKLLHRVTTNIQAKPNVQTESNIQAISGIS